MNVTSGSFFLICIHLLFASQQKTNGIFRKKKSDENFSKNVLVKKQQPRNGPLFLHWNISFAASIECVND